MTTAVMTTASARLEARLFALMIGARGVLQNRHGRAFITA
jgi:hypothetical protein